MEVIRQLAAEDAAAAAALEQCCFSDFWKQEELEEMLGNPLYLGFAAWEQDRLIGYCLLRIVAGEGELMRIGVRADSRGCGMGRKLMEAMENAARKKQAESIYLEVREGNHAARNLYKSRGFSEIGTRKGYYTAPSEAAVLMELKLA